MTEYGTGNRQNGDRSKDATIPDMAAPGAIGGEDREELERHVHARIDRIVTLRLGRYQNDRGGDPEPRAAQHVFS
jgi:hypothetical protein